MTVRIAVCTTRAGQTSTFWATSLAWTLAERRRVVLVDADMEGGTIADLLYLRLDDRNLANCFGDRSAATRDLEAQTVAVPGRTGLRVVPGLKGTFGADIVEALRQLGDAIRGLAADVVIADLGHPLAHPGLRSPRAAGDAITSLFDRVFVVVRDEPALLARSIEVLRAARLSHGELVVCQQRSRAHRRLMTQTIEREIPDLPLRNGWSWDESRASRMADTGQSMTLAGTVEELCL